MRDIYGFIVVLTCLFSSCGRCDKENNCRLTEKTNSYFGSFSDGEKWVFKKNYDSSSFDTLILVNKTQELEFSYTETECDGDYFEIIIYQLISSMLNDTLEVRLKSGPNSDNYSLRGFYDDYEITCYHQIDKKSGLFEPHPDNKLNIIETYTLNSKDYQKVVEITFNTFYPSFPEKAPRYVHSKDVGLIEFEIYSEILNTRVNYSLIKRITN